MFKIDANIGSASISDKLIASTTCRNQKLLIYHLLYCVKIESVSMLSFSSQKSLTSDSDMSEILLYFPMCQKSLGFGSKQQCSIAAVQHRSSIALQQCSTAAVQHRNSAAPQQCSTTAVQQCSSAGPQQCSTAVQVFVISIIFVISQKSCFCFRLVRQGIK